VQFGEQRAKVACARVNGGFGGLLELGRKEVGGDSGGVARMRPRGVRSG